MLVPVIELATPLPPLPPTLNVDPVPTAEAPPPPEPAPLPDDVPPA